MKLLPLLSIEKSAIKKHEERDYIYCGGADWTIEKLSEDFLMGEQRDGNAPTAQGQKEAPIWKLLPVLNIVLPRLHLLLGLSNDSLSHFRNWLEERVEPLTPEETEARNMTLLAEIAIEEAEEQLEQMKDALSWEIEKRKDLNKEMRQRGLGREESAALQSQKIYGTR
jgi:hypothetical protein